MTQDLLDIHTNQPAPRETYTVAKVIPPRVGERTLAATENLISSVSSEGHVLSLEMVGTNGGVSLMHRAERDDSLFRNMVNAHFPAAIVEAVPPEDDPLIPGPDEEAWTQTLKVVGKPYLPLRIFNTVDVQADHGADPMAAVVGAHSGLDAHERIVSRLVLKPLSDDWSEKYKRLALGGAGSHNAAQSIEEQREKSKPRSSSPSGSSEENNGAMTLFGGLALMGLFGFLGARWFSGLPMAQQVGAVALLVVAFMVVGIGSFVWWRRRNRKENVDDYVNPELAQSRLNDLAYQLEVQITVLANKHIDPEEHARLKLNSVVQAFRHYNHPEGSRLVAGEIRRYTGGQSLMSFVEPEPEPGVFGFLKREEPLDSVIGLHEVASMWHLPTKEDSSSVLEKSYGYDLPPPREMMQIEGAYVGDSTIGPEQKIMFSEDITRRHQFVIARTGMGKSTFIEHCVAHKLEQKALGQNDEAIVVVDPHSDLINSLLELTPPSLREKVWLIDLADQEHVPGINVLDAHIFPDRDHTVDGVIRVTKGIWDNWGGRMQNILEHTLKCLHEANSHKDTKREEQYTLLDARRMLNDDEYRAKVLERVDDVFLKRYWRDEFDKMPARLRGEAIAPVQTRLDYFASSKRPREILGQRQSTLDIRAAIENGDVIFVNTAQGTVGRDVAALVGASILNLVDAVIRQQALKPEKERRGVYIVVDEMQTIPGVNFQGMLSEVRKVGGALCLVTQSLSALSELGDTMRDVLLANMGCLIVFKVAGVDAQRLVVELDEDVVRVSDVMSLPPHHAFVRVTTSTASLPTFSMRLRYPQDGDAANAKLVRDLCENYTLSAAEVEEVMAREDYEEQAAKTAAQEAEQLLSEVKMEGGVMFVEQIEFGKKQQNGIGKKAAKAKRRNSRRSPNSVRTGGMNTKSDVGSTGKQGGSPGRNESAPEDDREVTQKQYEGLA